MATLIIGAAILVATVVIAARTSEGSWLIYFESIAKEAPRPVPRETQSLSTIPEGKIKVVPTDGIDIVATPSYGQAKNRISN